MTGLLNLPGVIELETEDEPHHYVIHAKSEKPVGKACNLGCNLRRNGTKPLDINDVPHHGKATLIKFRRQQFSCPGCKNEAGEVVGNDAISETPSLTTSQRLALAEREMEAAISRWVEATMAHQAERAQSRPISAARQNVGDGAVRF